MICLDKLLGEIVDLFLANATRSMHAVTGLVISRADGGGDCGGDHAIAPKSGNLGW